MAGGQERMCACAYPRPRHRLCAHRWLRRQRTAAAPRRACGGQRARPAAGGGREVEVEVLLLPLLLRSLTRAIAGYTRWVQAMFPAVEVGTDTYDARPPSNAGPSAR